MKNFPQVTKVKHISNIRYMPRRGKIRLGLKVAGKGDKSYPKEVDYFVCPPEVQKVFGEKPKILEIMFPINDVGMIFPQAYKYYGSSMGVKCKGNGVNAWRRTDSGDIVEVRCPCELLENKKCSLSGNLMFVIPRVGMGFVYQMDTGSYHSTVKINSGIAFIQGLVASATGKYYEKDKETGEYIGEQPPFALIPLTLERIPQKTGGGGSGGTKAQQTHYIVNLFSSITKDEIDKIQNNLARGHIDQIKLPAPEEVNPELDETQPLTKEEDLGGEIDESIIEGKEVDDTPEDEPPVASITRERTTEISFMGAKTMTAGISSKTASEVFDYKNTGPAQVNELKDFLAYLGQETIRDLTEEEGVLFLDGKKPETPEDKPPKEKKAAKKKKAASKTKDAFGEEESSLNKQFWAIANEIGVPKDKADNLKQLFYTFNKVKSFHDLTVDQWLYSIDMLGEYKKDPPSLFSTLDSLVIGDK